MNGSIEISDVRHEETIIENRMFRDILLQPQEAEVNGWMNKKYPELHEYCIKPLLTVNTINAILVNDDESRLLEPEELNKLNLENLKQGNDLSVRYKGVRYEIESITVSNISGIPLADIVLTDLESALKTELVDKFSKIELQTCVEQVLGVALTLDYIQTELGLNTFVPNSHVLLNSNGIALALLPVKNEQTRTNTVRSLVGTLLLLGNYNKNFETIYKKVASRTLVRDYIQELTKFYVSLTQYGERDTILKKLNQWRKHTFGRNGDNSNLEG